MLEGKRLNSHQNDRIDIMKYIQWQNEWDDFTRIRMGLQEDKAIIFEQWCAKIKSRKWSQQIASGKVFLYGYTFSINGWLMI